MVTVPVCKKSAHVILQNTFVTPREQVLVAHRTSAVRSAVPETSVVCFGRKLFLCTGTPRRVKSTEISKKHPWNFFDRAKVSLTGPDRLSE